MGKGEQKNIVNEVLEVFDSFIVVNLEQNTYTYHSRGEDDAPFESAEKGVYTDYVRSLYCGVYPLGDESATLEEYLFPVSIRRQMTPGRELLQWEYESSAKFHKTLYALCIQRKDDVPVGLLLASQDSGCQAGASQIFKAIEPSLSILAESVPDSKNRETDRECLKQKDYQGRRLLVVEDNALSREITEELLRMTGIEVETAANGKEAVSQMAAAPDGYYDMILMDVQMPVMSGYDAARAIRFLGREQASRIPIVAMISGLSAEDIAVKESGMSDCLEKPVRPCQLIETLDKYLA